MIVLLFILENLSIKHDINYNIDNDIDKVSKLKRNNNFDKCYLSPDNLSKRIIHLIITRFLIAFYYRNGFPKKLNESEYIPNGIRVMKKYLFLSLENQSCKNFIWILMLGNQANITYIKSFFNFSNSFEKVILFQKDIKNYVGNISKGFDILITTRIDYDDLIYYDAVNDVRKAINIDEPVLLYGYNKGVYFYEPHNKYYEFNLNYKKDGVHSIFASLIINLKQVNDSYIIYELGDHSFIRKKLLNSYKSFGIKELSYEPAIFDHGEAKFIYVKQKFSTTYNDSRVTPKILKVYDFNLTKFLGK